MLTIYLGKSAAGKDTYMKKSIAAGLKPVVTYTTRPMRSGEKDGEDYHFIDDNTFIDMINRNEFAEYRYYDTSVGGNLARWYYGSTPLDIKNEDYVIILDIKGAMDYIRMYGGKNIRVVYVSVEDEIRKERAKIRGSFDESEWERRCEDDNNKFTLEALTGLSKALGHEITVLYNNADKPTFGSI